MTSGQWLFMNVVLISIWGLIAVQTERIIERLDKLLERRGEASEERK